MLIKNNARALSVIIIFFSTKFKRLSPWYPEMRYNAELNGYYFLIMLREIRGDVL